MPDSAFVEGIKLVGGFLGIGTTVFTIWDRMFRNRPWATPFAEVDHGGSWVLSDYRLNTNAYIRVTNSSSRDIIITDVRQSRNEIGVVFHNSIHGIIASELNSRGDAIVPSGQSRLLGVHYDHEASKEALKRKFYVWLIWKPAGALLPRIPFFFRTSLESIDSYRRDVFETSRAKDKDI